MKTEELTFASKKSHVTEKLTAIVSAGPSRDAEVEAVASVVDKDDELKYSDIVVHRALGKGSYGTVYLATIKMDPEYTCAMKSLSHVNTKYTQERARKEYTLQDTLVHPNITLSLGFITSACQSAILMEYCDMGDLMRYMRQKCPEFPRSPERDKCFIRQIVTGVEYLHTQAKLIHMDVKAENILLTSGGVVKLTDFGLSFRIQDQRDVIQGDRGGTVIYKPPEFFFTFPAAFDSTTDVWAIGCLVFEMMDPNGAHPFFISQKFANPAARALNRQATLIKAVREMERMKFGTYEQGGFLNWTPEVQNFVRLTIGTTRLDRPLISELLATDWLRQEEPKPDAVSDS